MDSCCLSRCFVFGGSPPFENDAGYQDRLFGGQRFDPASLGGIVPALHNQCRSANVPYCTKENSD